MKSPLTGGPCHPPVYLVEGIDVMQSETRHRKKTLAFEPERVFNLPNRSEDLELDFDSATYRARKGEGGTRRATK